VGFSCRALYGRVVPAELAGRLLWFPGGCSSIGLYAAVAAQLSRSLTGTCSCRHPLVRSAVLSSLPGSGSETLRHAAEWWPLPRPVRQSGLATVGYDEEVAAQLYRTRLRHVAGGGDCRGAAAALERAAVAQPADPRLAGDALFASAERGL